MPAPAAPNPGGRPYGGLRPVERRTARREALVEAAFDRFGTDGYGAASIERLCAQAHVATRYFYEEFKDREQLLRAVYDWVVAGVRSAVLGALDTAGDGVRPRTEAAMGAFVHALLDDERRARIVCVQVVGVSVELEHHRRRVLHELADLPASEMRRLAAAGRIARHRHPEQIALALVGGTHELLADWLHREDRPPLDDLVADLVDLYLAAGAGPPDRAA